MMRAVAPARAPHKRLRIARRQSESAMPSTPRPQRRDCHGRLAKALLAMAGEDACLTEASFRPWCSATFIGAQHRFTLALTGEMAASRAAELAAVMGDAELPVQGHVLADIVVDRIRDGEQGSVVLDIAALTIEDW